MVGEGEEGGLNLYQMDSHMVCRVVNHDVYPCGLDCTIGRCSF